MSDGITISWFDDAVGIERELAACDLAGLHRVIAMRRRHCADLGDRRSPLQKWLVLGYFVLDGLGQCGTLTTSPTDVLAAISTNKSVIPLSQAERRFGTLAWGLGAYPVPPAAPAVCERCGHGWTLHNVADFQPASPQPIHARCHMLEGITQNVALFERIALASGLDKHLQSWRLIPNEYWGNDPIERYGERDPWCIYETDRGPVRIGWRKHVLSVDWSATSIAATGADIVGENKAVTHGAKMVHCWGEQKCIEALTRLVAAMEAPTHGH